MTTAATSLSSVVAATMSTVSTIASTTMAVTTTTGRIATTPPPPTTVVPSIPCIPLNSSFSFAVLGASTVTNTGSSVVTGDLGLYPGTSLIGFPPGIVLGTEHITDVVALNAQNDLTIAYTTLFNLPCDVSLTGQDLGGMVLTTGVYCFATSAQLTGTLTLDAQGNNNAVFVFQIGTTLTTAFISSVSIINGGSDCNVYWQVGSSATIGIGTTFVGNILALTSITATTGANIRGRLLARNGAVTLDSNTVSNALCNTCSVPNLMLGKINNKMIMSHKESGVNANLVNLFLILILISQFFMI